MLNKTVGQQGLGTLNPKSILSEPEKAWLAGVIDSEGSIYFRHGLDKQGWQIRQTVISFVNTSERFAKTVQEVMGGAMRVQFRTPRRKPLYRVELKPHKAVLAVLEQILPYLIVKKQLAEDTIDFIKNTDWRKAKSKTRPFSLSKAWEKRRILYPPNGMPRGWHKRA